MKIKCTDYKHRLLARITIETETPIAIGTGVSDITTDALVARDVNGLPYIPGTTLAGVIKSQLNVSKSDLWGYQEDDSGRGSEIIFSEAKILDSKGNVIDGIVDTKDITRDPLLANYIELPIRQHVCINERGVASKTGKFDEQIVYKGTQFCFEMEIVAKKDDLEEMQKVINAIRTQSFRIGGGTRKGFGKIRVVSVQSTDIDLSKELERYLSKSSNLQDCKDWWKDIEPEDCSPIDDENYTKYELHIQPQDFFMFGSGFGDETGQADKTSVKEGCVSNLSFEGRKTLIPATSVKGALRHRVAYHYNLLTHKYYGDKDATTASNNFAVKELFGYQDSKQHRGNVLISDVFEEPARSILVPHVSIDRFTGGAENGALFTEQVDYGKGRNFCIEIYVCNKAFENSDDERPIIKAFENALIDICKGMLPLGGSVNRGNGVFNGKLIKNGTTIYENRQD